MDILQDDTCMEFNARLRDHSRSRSIATPPPHPSFLLPPPYMSALTELPVSYRYLLCLPITRLRPRFPSHACPSAISAQRMAVAKAIWLILHRTAPVPSSCVTLPTLWLEIACGGEPYCTASAMRCIATENASAVKELGRTKGSKIRRF